MGAMYDGGATVKRICPWQGKSFSVCQWIESFGTRFQFSKDGPSESILSATSLGVTKHNPGSERVMGTLVI
eukprot:SAG11_NODE_3455_length_2438_cov_1.565626_2_plen_71_part_00